MKIQLSEILEETPAGAVQRAMALKARAELEDWVTKYAEKKLDPEYLASLMVVAANQVIHAYTWALFESKKEQDKLEKEAGGFSE